MGDVNKELPVGFIDESINALTSVDGLLAALEASTRTMESVGAIFRPIHSLKGNAARFGLMNIKKLSHSMENLLDQIRTGQCIADRCAIDSLAAGVELLRAMLLAVRDGNPEPSDAKKFNAVLHNIEHLVGNAVAPSGGDLIGPLIEQLRLHVSSEGKASLEELVRILSSIPVLANIKGNQGNRELNAVMLQGAAGQLYSLLRTHSSIPKASEAEKNIAGLIGQLVTDNCGLPSKTIMEIEDVFAVFTRADTGLDNLAVSMMLEKLTAYENGKPEGMGARENNPGAENGKPGEKNETKNKHDKTMRIPERTLDDFLRSVGELLGVEEMLRHVVREVQSGAQTAVISNSLKAAVGQFEGISKELRAQIMEVRKVEARILLQKTPRIVRDISAQSGKKMEVECIGEDIHIDKSYIDLLDAPLTHLVRNAADHGIEPPSQRLKAGKKETGKIIVGLRENADSLQLTISDDGAGLNYEGLQKKAIALGLVAQDAKLSKNDIVDLLFVSGVSTAQTATDVSGRGVGMDVVKRAVAEVGGKIEVSSDPGKGTMFTVSVPRNASTQILDGYMVRSFSEEIYVFPLANVVEAFVVLPGEISSVAGQGKVLVRRGVVFPFHTLDGLLGSHKDGHAEESGLIKMGVVVEMKGKRTVIAVKEILGIQKVVCKPVEGSILDDDLFNGAAISGTGHVSMIVNIEKMLKIQ